MEKNELNIKKRIKNIENKFAFVEKITNKIYQNLKEKNKIQKNKPQYHGFIITTGFDEKLYFKEFRNIKLDEISLIRPSKKIVPFIDAKFYNKKNQYIITAEMPGVLLNEIKINIDKNLVTISTNNTAKNYLGKVLLKRNIENKLNKMTYSNGILEIRINATTQLKHKPRLKTNQISKKLEVIK